MLDNSFFIANGLNSFFSPSLSLVLQCSFSTLYRPSFFFYFFSLFVSTRVKKRKLRKGYVESRRCRWRHCIRNKSYTTRRRKKRILRSIALTFKFTSMFEFFSDRLDGTNRICWQVLFNYVRLISGRFT
jgi:hypothetical protein